MVTIPDEAWIELKMSEEILSRLQAGGVDNWEGYEESLHGPEMPLKDFEKNLETELEPESLESVKEAWLWIAVKLEETVCPCAEHGICELIEKLPDTLRIPMKATLFGYRMAMGYTGYWYPNTVEGFAQRAELCRKFAMNCEGQ